MSLLEETYRKFDPEGEVNLAFDDAEVKESLSQISMAHQQQQQQFGLANGVTFGKKKGLNFLEA
jgi:hypothetical protein